MKIKHDKKIWDVCMVEDNNKEYHDTIQEILLEIKLKADKRLKKLKEENKNGKIQPKEFK